MNAAQFPAKVWDGTSPNGRPADDREAAPGSGDWDQIVAEVKAIEGKVVGPLTANAVTNVIPGVLRFDIADSSATTAFVLPYKVRVLDAWVVKTTANGGSGDTVQLKNGSTALSDAMSLNINTKLIARTASLDPAQCDIAAGGTLNVTAAKSTSVACSVYVLVARTP